MYSQFSVLHYSFLSYYLGYAVTCYATTYMNLGQFCRADCWRTLRLTLKCHTSSMLKNLTMVESIILCRYNFTCNVHVFSMYWNIFCFALIFVWIYATVTGITLLDFLNCMHSIVTSCCFACLGSLSQWK